MLNHYSKVASKAKYRSIYGEGLKILTPKKMFQRLPIILAQVRAGNTYENLLNKIRQIIYSLHQESIKQYNEFNKVMKQNGNYIYDSENCKTSDPSRLLLNLSDKVDLKRSDKYVALSNLYIYYIWKI